MSKINFENCPSCGFDLNAENTIFKTIKLSVIMPVYNEKATFLNIIEKVKSINIPKEIIIVDDYSSDGTHELIEQLIHESKNSNSSENSIFAIFHTKNLGKGASIKSGIQLAKGNVIIIQDADLEYDPKDFYKLISPIISGKADVVYGSRFLGGDLHRVLFFWHYFGNKLITYLSNMFTNLNFTDIETCYKVFRSDIIKSINIEQARFGFEVEITSKIAKLDCRIYEVGISYFGRTYKDGKKITWKDGIQAIYLIIKYH